MDNRMPNLGIFFYRMQCDWLNNIYSGNLFEEKKYEIPDFELKISENGNYDEVDLENPITLYNSLKELSLFASVRLIDVITEEDIYDFTYNKIESIILN